MACAHPFSIQIKDRFSIQTLSYNHYIPCGWCLNCRVDKANELTHRCEQELINYKCGAFVTLTYDDLHIVDKLRKTPNGDLVATVSKDDARKYMYRLRSNIKNKLPDTLLSNHHFKYLLVSEYGGEGQIFDRPHIHILLFGLDFAVCKKIIERSWQGKGIIKCLPILSGGIQYVLKYLDKQLHGKQAIAKYDDNNLEQPFQTHSLGLGKSLYENQKNYINSHNGCYRWKGKDVPVPPYYKNKYYFEDLTKNQKMTRQIEKYEKKTNIKFNRLSEKARYDLHDFNIRQNLIREENINVQNRLHGKPIYDYNALNQLKRYSK